MAVAVVSGGGHRGHDRTEAWKHSCMSRVKQLNLAMMMYTQDYDETLPAGNWRSELPTYTGRVLPPAQWYCPASQARSGYAFNGTLTGLQAEPYASNTMLYEVGPDGLAYRHNDGMVVGYVDGHARWSSQATVSKWQPTNLISLVP